MSTSSSDIRGQAEESAKKRVVGSKTAWQDETLRWGSTHSSVLGTAELTGGSWGRLMLC